MQRPLWYGWQNLIVDGASLFGALVLIGAIVMDAVLGREPKAPPSAALLPDLSLRADGAALTLRGHF